MACFRATAERNNETYLIYHQQDNIAVHFVMLVYAGSPQACYLCLVSPDSDAVCCVNVADSISASSGLSSFSLLSHFVMPSLSFPLH